VEGVWRFVMKNKVGQEEIVTIKHRRLLHGQDFGGEGIAFNQRLGNIHI